MKQKERKTKNHKRETTLSETRSRKPWLCFSATSNCTQINFTKMWRNNNKQTKDTLRDLHTCIKFMAEDTSNGQWMKLGQINSSDFLQNFKPLSAVHSLNYFQVWACIWQLRWGNTPYSLCLNLFSGCLMNGIILSVKGRVIYRQSTLFSSLINLPMIWTNMPRSPQCAQW